MHSLAFMEDALRRDIALIVPSNAIVRQKHMRGKRKSKMKSKPLSEPLRDMTKLFRKTKLRVVCVHLRKIKPCEGDDALSIRNNPFPFVIESSLPIERNRIEEY